eukprot:s1198_g20.t1
MPAADGAYKYFDFIAMLMPRSNSLDGQRFVKKTRIQTTDFGLILALACFKPSATIGPHVVTLWTRWRVDHNLPPALKHRLHL